MRKNILTLRISTQDLTDLIGHERDVVVIVDLLKEAVGRIFDIIQTRPQLFFFIFSTGIGKQAGNGYEQREQLSKQGPASSEYQ